ncbi:MAG: hypothetical protein OEY19_14210 [Gammaproteobacteria bacterium]|nr:hypothetical protein [Gammaproteobacteria bacterium]MDH5630725.1 hypothetical protein [Gammaproteobacteria bacterium]
MTIKLNKANGGKIIKVLIDVLMLLESGYQKINLAKAGKLVTHT